MCKTVFWFRQLPSVFLGQTHQIWKTVPFQRWVFETQTFKYHLWWPYQWDGDFHVHPSELHLLLLESRKWACRVLLVTADRSGAGQCRDVGERGEGEVPWKRNKHRCMCLVLPGTWYLHKLMAWLQRKSGSVGSWDRADSRVSGQLWWKSCCILFPPCLIMNAKHVC